MTITEWNAYPKTLRVQHIADIYGYSVETVRTYARKRNPKIPTPCVTRAFGWNRDDVRRHYERRVA